MCRLCPVVAHRRELLCWSFAAVLRVEGEGENADVLGIGVDKGRAVYVSV